MADTVSSAWTLSPAPGGVTAPAGFSSASVWCGIKRSASELDLAVLAADRTVPAAALLTTNLAKAAPVLVCREHLARTGGRARAIVVNSGCANACTGDTGLAHAHQMAADAAAALRCSPEEILVASTGVIGVGLPIEGVSTGIRTAASRLSRDAGSDMARAIMTTDPFPKSHAVSVRAAGGTFFIGGTAKGSGMIEPNMATMLGFLTTDAIVPPGLLLRALRESAIDTFNAITVDGECSTNDSLFALASGASGIAIDEESYTALLDGLRAVSRELALGVVRGGEGATKLVAVTVRDASCEDDARRVARTIANSLLVKTAVHGADPNWGRIVAAAGRSGVTFDPRQVTVYIGSTLLFAHGLPYDAAAPEAAEYLKGKDLTIDVGLGTGGGATATIWTCDLSAEYVRINAEYRT